MQGNGRITRGVRLLALPQSPPIHSLPHSGIALEMDFSTALFVTRRELLAVVRAIRSVPCVYGWLCIGSSNSKHPEGEVVRGLD